MSEHPDIPKFRALPEEVGEKILWALILLPGFVTFTIIDQISEIYSTSEFRLVLYSFSLTVFDIVVALGIYFLVVKTIQKLREKFSGRGWSVLKFPDTDAAKRSMFASITVIVAVLAGIGFGVSVQDDKFYEYVSKLEIFGKVDALSRRTPLDYLISRNKGSRFDGAILDGEPTTVAADARRFSGERIARAWFTVRMTDGRLYEGYPFRYDPRPGLSELYLSPACEILENEEKDMIRLRLRPIKGPGVVLMEKHIRMVYLTDGNLGLCNEYWGTKPSDRDAKFPGIQTTGSLPPTGGWPLRE